MTNPQPGTKVSAVGTRCWQSLTNRTITTVEPSSSSANRFIEGRFLSKEDLIALSFQVAAEIYAKQQAERPDLIPKIITEV